MAITTGGEVNTCDAPSTPHPPTRFLLRAEGLIYPAPENSVG